MADAIEQIREAVQDYVDGPLAYLRGAADRAAAPNYDADTAAADRAGFCLELAKAFWGGVNAVVNATAYMASPATDAVRFEVPITPVTTSSIARVVNKQWNSVLFPEPPGALISFMPPLPLSPLLPGTAVVELCATPSTDQPFWIIDLEITPLGAAHGTPERVYLNASTERLSPGP